MDRSMPTSKESVLAHLPWVSSPRTRSGSPRLANWARVSSLVRQLRRHRHRRASRRRNGRAGPPRQAQRCSSRHVEPGHLPWSGVTVVSVAVAGLTFVTGRRLRHFRGCGTDRASGFGAGSTRNMAKNGLREATVDTDVLAGDITR
jgi:hypothetical protein